MLPYPCVGFGDSITYWKILGQYMWSTLFCSHFLTYETGNSCLDFRSEELTPSQYEEQ